MVIIRRRVTSRGVGQGYVHHEAPLIIIMLNVVLLPLGDDQDSR